MGKIQFQFGSNIIFHGWGNIKTADCSKWTKNHSHKKNHIFCTIFLSNKFVWMIFKYRILKNIFVYFLPKNRNIFIHFIFLITEYIRAEGLVQAQAYSVAMINDILYPGGAGRAERLKNNNIWENRPEREREDWATTGIWGKDRIRGAKSVNSPTC